MPYKDKQKARDVAAARYWRMKVENPEKLKEWKERHNQRMRDFWKNNPEAAKQKNRETYRKYKHVFEKARKKWNSGNPQRIKESSARYYLSHKKEKADYQRKWATENKDHKNAKQRELRATNASYAMAQRLRCRMNSALRNFGLKRDASLEDLLGCTVGQLMQQLESQFPAGMGWHNRNLWHIDHIVPCSAFDLTQPEQRATCFHHSNLQPLWASDNIRKGGVRKQTNRKEYTA